MKKNKLLRTFSLTISLILLFSILVYGDSTTVVTLGANLSDSQKNEMLKLFNVKEDEVIIIEVNNQEERQYLEGVASEAQLGSKTMSSAYVDLQDSGEGITVQTYNINWVTEEMYTSALVTAGVKDAKVIAAAPFPVSGTGALTGIIKAFEQATGKTIDENQKKVANEEIIKTGELGEIIGKEKAAELIKEIKNEIIAKGIKSPEDIKKVIVEIAGKLDINLNEDQLQTLNDLMEKISKLDLNTEDIKNQLKNIGKKLDDTLKNNEEVKGILAKLLEAIKAFFRSLFSK